MGSNGAQPELQLRTGGDESPRGQVAECYTFETLHQRDPERRPGGQARAQG